MQKYLFGYRNFFFFKRVALSVEVVSRFPSLPLIMDTIELCCSKSQINLAVNNKKIHILSVNFTFNDILKRLLSNVIFLYLFFIWKSFEKNYFIDNQKYIFSSDCCRFCLYFFDFLSGCILYKLGRKLPVVHKCKYC